MRLSIGQFYPAKSILHSLDPRLKFLFSIAGMVLLFSLKNWPSMLFFFGVMVLMIALSKVPVKLILRSLKPVLFIGIFAFVLNLFSVKGDALWRIGPVDITVEGLQLGLRMAFRLFSLVAMTSLLLTLTTTPLQISAALESLFKPLGRLGFPSHELAMMMSIALRFIPTLMEETDRLMKAQSSRGANYDSGGFISRLKGLLTILIPLFVSAFKRADDLALAMEARCYRGGEGRTKLNVLRYQKMDVYATLCFVVLAAILIGLSYGV